MLSADQLAGVQGVASVSLTDTAILCPRVKTASAIGGDDKYTWPPGETVPCSIRQMNDSHLAAQLGLIVAEGVFRINFTVDVFIDTDDQVEIAGVRYTVQNTNKENTIKVFFEAYARKLE